MRYRENAAPAARVFQTPIEPLAVTIFHASFITPFVMIVIVMLGVALTDGVPTSARTPVRAGALVLMLGVIAWAWTRQARSVVRFTVADAAVTMEWCRGGRVARTERIAIDDLVDVAIDDLPASGGGHTHQVVLTTRAGYVALQASSSKLRWAHRQQQKQLAAFLGIPALE